MGGFIQTAPLFIFPAIALLVGVIHSWRGILDRDKYLAWGLGVTCGIPALLTLMFVIGFQPPLDEGVSDGPDALVGLIFTVWINGALGAVTVVLVALLDKVASDG